MKGKLSALVNLVGGLLLAVGPWTIFTVCPTHDKVMACFYSARAVTVFGVLLLLFGVLQFLPRRGRWVGCLFSAAAFAAVAAIPGIAVGGCANVAMPCRQAAFPAIYLVCILGAAAQLWLALAYRKAENKPGQ